MDSGETTLKSSFQPLDLSQVTRAQPSRARQEAPMYEGDDLTFKGESEFHRAFQGVKVSSTDHVIVKKPPSERNMLGKEDRDFQTEMHRQFVLPADYQHGVLPPKTIRPSVQSTLVQGEREKFSGYSRHKDDYPVYSSNQLIEARVTREKTKGSSNCLTRDVDQNSYATEMTTQFIPRQLPEDGTNEDEDVEFVDV